MPRMLRAAFAATLLSIALTGCQLLEVVTPHERPIDLDYAAPLDEAIAAAEKAGYEVVGFEFSNGPVYGGISFDEGETVAEVLDEFEAEYGTVPVVVKVVVSSASAFDAGPIVTGRTEDFTAPDAAMPGATLDDVATYTKTAEGGDAAALAGVLAGAVVARGYCDSRRSLR
jgi:hypothetical protein